MNFEAEVAKRQKEKQSDISVQLSANEAVKFGISEA